MTKIENLFYYSLLKKIKNVIIGILKEFVNLQESLFKM